jgi:ADP-ribose pyrophosphatase
MSETNPPLIILRRNEVALQNPADITSLKLMVVSYRDRKGVDREWEYVTRIKDLKVVTVIAHTLKGSILFVKQPRATFNQYLLSFPAGLIEPHETVTEGGARELKEETGYIIRKEDILSISPFMAISPGLSTEVVAVIEVLIRSVVVIGSQHLREGEDIEWYWITPQKLYDTVQHNLLPPNTLLDAQVWYYIRGIVRTRSP